MKIRYRWSHQFQVWVRLEEIAPAGYPYWLCPAGTSH